MKLIKLTVATLLALGAAQAQAQPTTNVVQTINIQLFGIEQGRTVTNGGVVSKAVDVVRVDSRRVIQELGRSTQNSFSAFARLVLVTPLGGGAPAIQVRSGTAVVDVTDFFVLQPLSDSVESSQKNLRRGIIVETDYFIQRIALQNSGAFPALGLHFDVNGFATQVAVTGANSPLGAGLDVGVSGSGDRNGSLLILQGSIGVFGHALEVVEDDGGGSADTN